MSKSHKVNIISNHSDITVEDDIYQLAQIDYFTMKTILKLHFWKFLFLLVPYCFILFSVFRLARTLTDIIPEYYYIILFGVFLLTFPVVFFLLKWLKGLFSAVDGFITFCKLIMTLVRALKISPSVYNAIIGNVDNSLLYAIIMKLTKSGVTSLYATFEKFDTRYSLFLYTEEPTESNNFIWWGYIPSSLIIDCLGSTPSIIVQQSTILLNIKDLLIKEG